MKPNPFVIIWVLGALILFRLLPPEPITTLLVFELFWLAICIVIAAIVEAIGSTNHNGKDSPLPLLTDKPGRFERDEMLAAHTRMVVLHEVREKLRAIPCDCKGPTNKPTDPHLKHCASIHGALAALLFETKADLTPEELGLIQKTYVGAMLNSEGRLQ